MQPKNQTNQPRRATNRSANSLQVSKDQSCDTQKLEECQNKQTNHWQSLRIEQNKKQVLNESLIDSDSWKEHIIQDKSMKSIEQQIGNILTKNANQEMCGGCIVYINKQCKQQNLKKQIKATFLERDFCIAKNSEDISQGLQKIKSSKLKILIIHIDLISPYLQNFRLPNNVNLVIFGIGLEDEKTYGKLIRKDEKTDGIYSGAIVSFAKNWSSLILEKIQNRFNIKFTKRNTIEAINSFKIEKWPQNQSTLSLQSSISNKSKQENSQYQQKTPNNKSSAKHMNWATHIFIQYNAIHNANNIESRILQQLINTIKACIIKKSRDAKYTQIEKIFQGKKQLLGVVGVGRIDELQKGIKLLKDGKIKVLVIGDQVTKSYSPPQYVDLCINWENTESLKLYGINYSKFFDQACENGLVITFCQSPKDKKEKLQKILTQISQQFDFKFLHYTEQQVEHGNVNFLEYLQHAKKQKQANMNIKDQCNQTQIKLQKQLQQYNQNHHTAINEKHEKTQEYQIMSDQDGSKDDKNEERDTSKFGERVKEQREVQKQQERKRNENIFDSQKHFDKDNENDENMEQPENGHTKSIKIDQESLNQFISYHQTQKQQSVHKHINSSLSSQNPKIFHQHQHQHQNQQDHYQKHSNQQKQKGQEQQTQLVDQQQQKHDQVKPKKQEQQQHVTQSDPQHNQESRGEQKIQKAQEEKIPPVLNEQLEIKGLSDAIVIKLNQMNSAIVQKISRLQASKQSMEQIKILIKQQHTILGDKLLKIIEDVSKSQREIANEQSQGIFQIIAKIQEKKLQYADKVDKINKQAAQRQQRGLVIQQDSFQIIKKDTIVLKESMQNIVSSMGQMGKRLALCNDEAEQRMSLIKQQIKQLGIKYKQSERNINDKIVSIQNDFSFRNQQAKVQLSKQIHQNNLLIIQQTQQNQKVCRQFQERLKKQKQNNEKQSLKIKLLELEDDQKQLRKQFGHLNSQSLQKNIKLKAQEAEINDLKDNRNKLEKENKKLESQNIAFQEFYSGYDKLVKQHQKMKGDLKKSENDLKNCVNESKISYRSKEEQRKKLVGQLNQKLKQMQKLNSQNLQYKRKQKKTKDLLIEIIISRDQPKRSRLAKGFNLLRHKSPPPQERNNLKQKIEKIEKIEEMKIDEIIDKHFKSDTERNKQTIKILYDFQQQVPQHVHKFMQDKDHTLLNKINQYAAKISPHNQELVCLFEIQKQLIEQLIKQNEKKLQFEGKVIQFRASLKQNWKSDKKIQNLKSQYITKTTEAQINYISNMILNAAAQNAKKKVESDKKSQQLQALMKTLESERKINLERMRKIQNQKQTAIKNFSEDLKLARQENDKLNRNNSELQQKYSYTNNSLAQMQTNYKNLENTHANKIRQAQERHQLSLEELKQSYQKNTQKSLLEQKKKLEENFDREMESRKTRHSDEVKSILRRSQDLQNRLNQKIKQCLKIEFNLNSQNYKQKLSDLPNMISQIRIMPQSNIYSLLDPQYKNFILSAVKDIVPKKITHSRTLFVGYQNSVFQKWLNLIQDNENILVLIKLTNGHIIGGFSEDPYSKNNKGKGQGFMMSVTNQLVYKIKAQGYGRVLKRDDYFFVFGNDELIIKYKENKPVYSVIFDKTNLFFETKGKNIIDFLGSENEDGDCERIQFHQLYFK